MQVKASLLSRKYTNVIGVDGRVHPAPDLEEAGAKGKGGSGDADDDDDDEDEEKSAVPDVPPHDPRPAFVRVREFILENCDAMEAKTLFVIMDTDANGHLDRDEFQSFVDSCVSGMGDMDPLPEEDIESTFAHIDLDGNGTIERNEFMAWLKEPEEEEEEDLEDEVEEGY